MEGFCEVKESFNPRGFQLLQHNIAPQIFLGGHEMLGLGT
jgi:hypothetical protein